MLDTEMQREIEHVTTKGMSSSESATFLVFTAVSAAFAGGAGTAFFATGSIFGTILFDPVLVTFT